MITARSIKLRENGERLRLMSDNVYILGKGPAPIWCEKLLMPYQKANGSVGYEFHGRVQIYELTAGDTLIRHGTRIDVRKKARR